jgi:Reverse transcriptase (RNA-dependent DNA polymerase)
LKKIIYGLKQFSKTWYDKLNSYLNFYNFTVSSADHSLFIKRNDNSTTIVLVYVDDIIIIGNDQGEINNVKSQLKENF